MYDVNVPLAPATWSYTTPKPTYFTNQWFDLSNPAIFEIDLGNIYTFIDEETNRCG